MLSTLCPLPLREHRRKALNPAAPQACAEKPRFPVRENRVPRDCKQPSLQVRSTPVSANPVKAFHEYFLREVICLPGIFGQIVDVVPDIISVQAHYLPQLIFIHGFGILQLIQHIRHIRFIPSIPLSQLI
ncbi:hypothetical protein D3C79_848930 [compost metagenome]